MSKLMKLAKEFARLNQAYDKAEQERREAKTRSSEAFSRRTKKGEELQDLALDDEDDRKRLVIVPDDEITEMKVIEINQHGVYINDADNPKKDSE